MEQFNALKSRLETLYDLSSAAGILGWDMRTKMPPGGTPIRARQLATLARLGHEMFTSDAFRALLEAAEAEGADFAYDSDEAALLRETRRQFDLRTKLPADLVAEQSRVASLAEKAWEKARAEDDYASFAPWLEQNLDLARQRAEYYGYDDVPYDALLNLYEPGMKTAEVARVFAVLKAEQSAIVQAIAGQNAPVDGSIIEGDFPEAAQYAFIMGLVPRLGYDFERGRLDKTTHPFASGAGRGDTRITTRYNPRRLNAALFGSLHETGHALYEQGVGEAISGTLLGRGTSLGIHESQSRLWENLIGRSMGFWERFYPDLQAAFPQPFAGVPLEDFYRAINQVQPSLIRVEADEVTYNLHIIIRFELENDLLEGRLSVADAPDAWNAKYSEYLGVTPPTAALGIMQDIHWSGGMFGYFPTYALGNVMSVQFYNKAIAENPAIPDQIAAGEFGDLLAWLQANIYQHGKKYLPAELLERVTGSALDAGPYLAYLREKYGAIYAL